MLSRGALGLASPRVRRGLALSWTALFILSLLLQYVSFVTAPAALAAHNEGIFELEGNALDQATAGADWENGPEGATAAFFAGAASEAEANDSTYFTGGGSKDENDVPSWEITSTSVPDKDELTDAYGAIYQSGGETWFYFGADRFDNDGDAQIGFWFFQKKVGIANGDFTGKHTDGDVLILSEYTNGGVVDLVCAYEWDGSGGGSNIAKRGDCDPATSGSNLNLVAAGAECDVADGTFDICAVTNADTATAPWTFTNKDGGHNFAAGQFFEGGINLSAMFGGDPPCFGTFLAETRSSQETDAQLKDFAFGSLNTCVPPTIATQVRQDGQSLGSVGTISLGDTVTDHATFSGNHGAVTGSAAFHVCFNASSTPNCATGGTAAGTDTISGGAADSDPFTPSAVGYYCFRVDYTPTADSEYLAGSHTNQTTECFQVLPANVTIAKKADAGSVEAGDQIGFTLSWGNTKPGKATGVVITDTLPADPGLSWHIAGSTGTGSTCAIAAGVLTCNVGTIDGNIEVSGTVHIVSDTTEASCGTIDNTGAITSSNDGSGEASASVIVVCPESLFIDKQLADTGATDPDLNVPLAEIGDTLHYTLAYAGAGPITNAVITDVIPEGLEYVDGSAAGDANFTFDSYDATTRTLTWTAATLPSPASGAVTYDALVLASAPDEPQPLVNVATIVSDRTPPDSDQESVAVLAPPEALTPPPTDVVSPATASGNPGFTLMLILLAIAGLAIGIGFVTPAPPAASGRPDRER